MGSFYAQLGEYEKARQSFEEALELNPDHKGTIDAMAMYTNSPDQKTLSEQILGMSSKRAPDGPAQKLTTIRQRLVEGNYTDALRLCEEGQKNFPLVVIRPSIIAAAYSEPFPGWTDSLGLMSGLYAIAGHGILRDLPINPELIGD